MGAADGRLAGALREMQVALLEYPEGHYADGTKAQSGAEENSEEKD